MSKGKKVESILKEKKQPTQRIKEDSCTVINDNNILTPWHNSNIKNTKGKHSKREDQKGSLLRAPKHFVQNEEESDVTSSSGMCTKNLLQHIK